MTGTSSITLSVSVSPTPIALPPDGSSVDAIAAFAATLSKSSCDGAVLTATTSLLSVASSESYGSPSDSTALATSIVDAATSILDASCAALPPAAAEPLLGAVSNALMLTFLENPPAPIPLGYNATNTLPLTADLPTGGVPLSLIPTVMTTLSGVTTSLVSTAPAGSSRTVTTAPVEASVPGANYCGPGITSTVFKPGAVARSSTLSLSPALNPCLSLSSNGLVTLPYDIVTAQPAPALSITVAAVAALSRVAPGATVSLTQWGISPFNETAGVDALSYAAPPAVSDISLASTAAAAQALSNTPARRLARALGVTSLDVVLAATGGTSAASAAQAALTDPSKGGTPRATTAIDLLPGRPLDSRVLSVRVTDAAGKAVDLSRGVFPVSVTVPFRDLSIVKWNAALKTATVDIGNSGFAQPVLSVICPTSTASAARGIVATYVRGGIGSAVVRLKSAQLVEYTGVVGTTTTSGTAGSLSNIAAPDGASVATDLLTISNSGGGRLSSDVKNISTGAALSAQAPVVASASYVFTLSTDCGPAFRTQTFVCGAGFAGSTITFACPAVVALPSCLRYNSSVRRWATAGCSVVSSSVTSAECACDGPGDIAVRFAALAQQQQDVYALGSAAAVSFTLSIWVGLFALLGIVFGINICGVIFGRDGELIARWATHMAADAEFHAIPPGAWPTSVGLGSAKVAPDGPTNKETPSAAGGSSTASVRPLVGAKLSRDATISALGTALERVATPHRVASSIESDIAFVRIIASWRAAMRLADAGVIAPSESPHRGTFTAVVRARYCFGEPPAIFVAAWPLFRFTRAHYYYDASAAAIAAPPLTKLLGSLAAAASTVSGTAVLYSYLLSISTAPGSPALSALTSVQPVALAIAVSVIVVLPFDVAILAALRFRARTAARSRFPGLAKELARRELATKELAALPTSALLRIAAAAESGRGSAAVLATVSAAEFAAADAGAPPRWAFEPPTELAQSAVGRVLLSIFARSPSNRADLISAAANAAAIAGADSSGDASLIVGRLRALLDGSDTDGSSFWSVFFSLLVDLSLAAITIFGAIYCASFALSRGPVATAGTAGAWAFSMFLSAAVIRPAIIAGRSAFAFASGGAFASPLSPLTGWYTAIAAPAAAAAAAGSGAAPFDAAAALIAPDLLAASLAAKGAPAAHASLRASAFVHVYRVLTNQHNPSADADSDLVKDFAGLSISEDASSVLSAPSTHRPTDPVPLPALPRPAPSNAASVAAPPPSTDLPSAVTHLWERGNAPQAVVVPPLGRPHFSIFKVKTFKVSDDDGHSVASGSTRGMTAMSSPRYEDGSAFTVAAPSALESGATIRGRAVLPRALPRPLLRHMPPRGPIAPLRLAGAAALSSTARAAPRFGPASGLNLMPRLGAAGITPALSRSSHDEAPKAKGP